MNGEYILHIENLVHTYHQEPVLKKINLDLSQGFISIIGPNGSGKTTLLKLACGLLKIQQGSISFQGKPLQSLSLLQRARQFTAILQNQFFPIPFTCLEMVGLGRYPHRKDLHNMDTTDYEIIMQAMRDTDTIQFSEKLISEISGGEQQRVLLASALAQQPKILFLDEAFSAMDICYKARLTDLLKKMVEDKRLTVISIVHDLNFAYRYSDTVCILKNGKIVDVGQPQETMTEETISRVFEVNVNLIERRCFIY